jgi:hypothetical protein
VSGDVDGQGCNIGVYFGPGHKGSVFQADVHGATDYGLLNNGATVSVEDSAFHDINGDGILWGYGNHRATGKIHDNLVYRYQNVGIVVAGAGNKATVTGNSVLGSGPTSSIVQSGIEVETGSTATVTDNYVADNEYTGRVGVSGVGLAVFGGCGGLPTSNGVTVDHNRAISNDIGIVFHNPSPDCSSYPATPTRDEASYNFIINDQVNNTAGCQAVQHGCTACGKTLKVCGYQAGIYDVGYRDRLEHNTISGRGYTPVVGPPDLLCIDTSGAKDAILAANHCPKRAQLGPRHESTEGGLTSPINRGWTR